MSRLLTDRVWAAHPVQPQHRCVLLAIARETADGALHVSVNRRALGRSVEASAAVVTAALKAGEAVDLLRVVKGIIHWSGYEGSLTAAPPRHTCITDDGGTPARTCAACVAEGRTAVRLAEATLDVPKATPHEVVDAFRALWERRYHGQQYAPPAGTYRQAEALTVLPLEETRRRAITYLASEDPFYVQKRHPFSFFAGRVNEFVPYQAKPRTPEAPATDGWRERFRRGE